MNVSPTDLPDQFALYFSSVGRLRPWAFHPLIKIFVMCGNRRNDILLHGVVVEPLRQFKDERGRVMHMLRCDSTRFEQFGEIYFSAVKPGTVKAWRRHQKMTLNYAVPIGNIKLVLYDDRSDSPTAGRVQELFIGQDNYVLVKIPPNIWYGFQGLGDSEALLANCATLPHDPDEITRCDPDDGKIPYKWGH